MSENVFIINNLICKLEDAYSKLDCFVLLFMLVKSSGFLFISVTLKACILMAISKKNYRSFSNKW